MQVKGRLILQAANVHHGGGAVLLRELLIAASTFPGPTVAFLDSRATLPADVANRIEVRRVPPRVISRLRGEWQLARTANAEDVVVCLGNLPPLFRCRGRVVVMIQNRYAVESVKLPGLSLRVRTRTWIERHWLRRFARHVNIFLVQTPLMRELLRDRLGADADIRCIAFATRANTVARQQSISVNETTRPVDFVYVASGEAHKNHANLIAAWRLLAQEGLFPSLCVTLAPHQYPTLCDDIDHQCARYGLRINNVGTVSHAEVGALYSRARALIFPSLFESLGLPLIEARQAGLAIVAAERDYVRELIDPEASFDPESPRSIASAVRRFLGIKAPPFELVDAAMVLRSICESEA
jgi:glycosyltransferase involved in cell wall biosynthesis